MAFTALLGLLIVQKIYLISNDNIFYTFKREFMQEQIKFKVSLNELRNPDFRLNEQNKIANLKLSIKVCLKNLNYIRERITDLIGGESIFASARYHVLLQKIDRQIRILKDDNFAKDLIRGNTSFYLVEIKEKESKYNPAKEFEKTPSKNTENNSEFEKICPNAPKAPTRKYNTNNFRYQNSEPQDINPFDNTSALIYNGSSITSGYLRAAQAVIGCDSGLIMSNFNDPNNMEGRENRKNEMRNDMGNEMLFRTPERRAEEDESSQSTSGKKVDKRKTRR